MQVDFVVFKRCGERLSAFVATLGYSRMSFVRLVRDETWPTVKALGKPHPSPYLSRRATRYRERGGTLCE